MNDAPALKAANVGIAVAGATPAAQGAADIVLTQVCPCCSDSVLPLKSVSTAEAHCTHFS